MVRLFVENTNLHGPIAAIRWCVDGKDLEKLKEQHVINPFLLILVCEKHGDKFFSSDFKIVPLGQVMEYIEFNRSGDHRIFACLVWSGYKREKDAIKALNQGIFKYYFSHGGRYASNSEGEFIRPEEYTDLDLEHDSIDVVVPEGYFAKEPAAWEKWWVNLWFDYDATNQCHFRKRRFLAYSVQPPIILLFVLAKGLAMLGEVLILLLLGMRGIKFEAIIHPFRYSLDWECKEENSSSFFGTDRFGKERHWTFGLLTPMVQLVFLVIAVVVKLILGWLGVNIGILVGMFVVNVFFMAIGFGISILGDLDRFFPKETEEQRDERQRLELERFYGSYQDMVCGGVIFKTNVSALPPKRRTVYLRFRELKSKVCLPFAR